ncbi:MAG: hypothetical protein K1X54_03290 [Flavobacteriales bacterium]|nr:hypothetical protein [Flavobacteriales bacterium]
MKITLAFFIALFSIQNTFAGHGDDTGEKTRSAIAAEIGRQLSYHELSDSFRGGVAFAEVRVLESGMMEVMNVNAATQRQREIIEREIESIQLNLPSNATGKTFAFRFHFVQRNA